MIRSIVFDYLERVHDNSDDIALACIYFNYKEALNPAEILASVLKQLLKRSAVLPQEIQDFYSSHCREKTRPILGELSALLCSLQSKLHLAKIFIVVDALDEYLMDEYAGVKVVSELHRIPNSRFLITGRPHVERIISNFEFTSVEIRGSDEDIRRSLRTLINESPQILACVKTDTELRTIIIDEITKDANGMYILASSVMILIY
jgi:hypothetical protein